MGATAGSAAMFHSIPRFYKFFLHKNGLTLLVILAALKQPFYHLHWWVYVNLIMSIFFIYILTVREQINEACDDNFWWNPSKENIMQEYLQEYACVVDDRRFFRSTSPVYGYFLLNVILTPFLLYFLLTASQKIMPVLLVQGIATIAYLVSKSWSFPFTLKSTTYTLVSALWVIYPLVLYFSLQSQ